MDFEQDLLADHFFVEAEAFPIRTVIGDVPGFLGVWPTCFHLTFQHFTKYGKKDGIIFFQLAQIKNIDFEDQYTKSIAYVIQHSEKIAKENSIEIIILDDENWKNDILNQLNKKTEIISSIKVYGEYYTGFILEVDEDSFIIRCIDSLGMDQGLSMFKTEDITDFKLNDIDNRKRLLLYNWRKSLQIK